MRRKNCGAPCGALIGSTQKAPREARPSGTPLKNPYDVVETATSTGATLGVLALGGLGIELLAQVLLPPAWRVGLIGAGIRTAGGLLLGAGAERVKALKPYAEQLQYGGLALAGIQLGQEHILPRLPARGKLTTLDAIQTYALAREIETLRAAPASPEAQNVLALQEARRALLAPPAKSGAPGGVSELPAVPDAIDGIEGVYVRSPEATPVPARSIHRANGGASRTTGPWGRPKLPF